MRSLLWRPGHSAQSSVAAVNDRLMPLIPVGQAPTSGSLVTSGTTDYGAWVEMNAATAEDWWGFMVHAPNSAGSALHQAGFAHGSLIDVGIGAAASEVAIISGMDISQRDVSGMGSVVDARYLFVPKGSRVAVRVASTSSARTVTLAANGYKPADRTLAVRPIAKAHALVTPASRRGTAVPAGTSWTQIVASTSQRFEALLLGIGINESNTTGGVRRFDLAFGASGAETLVWSLGFTVSSTEALYMNGSTFIPISVPPGTRICARGEGDDYSLTIHGLN